jgi:hypothetical protein
VLRHALLQLQSIEENAWAGFVFAHDEKERY